MASVWRAFFKYLLPHLPVYVGMLAGAIVCLVAWVKKHRRLASGLGAIGFAIIFLLNLGGYFIPNLMSSLQDRGVATARLNLLYTGITVAISLVDAVAFGLLAAGVLLPERRRSEERPGEVP
jgi:hypothetical protein